MRTGEWGGGDLLTSVVGVAEKRGHAGFYYFVFYLSFLQARLLILKDLVLFYRDGEIILVRPSGRG